MLAHPFTCTPKLNEIWIFVPLEDVKASDHSEWFSFGRMFFKLALSIAIGRQSNPYGCARYRCCVQLLSEGLFSPVPIGGAAIPPLIIATQALPWQKGRKSCSFSQSELNRKQKKAFPQTALVAGKPFWPHEQPQPGVETVEDLRLKSGGKWPEWCRVLSLFLQGSYTRETGHGYIERGS